MATKPRSRKTPLQLWIVDNRKRLELAPADIGRVAGVSEDTARAWESRGRPGADALAALERLFGSAAPDVDQPGGVDASALVAAIDRLTAAVERGQVERRAWEMELIRAVAELRGAPMPAGEPASGPPEGALR